MLASHSFVHVFLDQNLMFHWYIPCAQKLITPSAQHNCISFFEFFTALDMHAENNVRGRGLEMTASFTISSFILLLLLDWPTTSLDADDNEALIDYSLSKKLYVSLYFHQRYEVLDIQTPEFDCVNVMVRFRAIVSCLLKTGNFITMAKEEILQTMKLSIRCLYFCL